MFNSSKGIIKNWFGSKRGLVRTMKHSILNVMGKYKPCKNVNFSEVERLIFVCSGNICRSPLAEYVAKCAGVSSVSYGLHCRGGDKADSRAILFAKERGLNLNGHLTKNISQYEPQPGDLLVGMEPKHLEEAKQHLAGRAPKMTLAGLWLKFPRPYLHDPYNTNQTFFKKCEMLVMQSAQTISKKVNH